MMSLYEKISKIYRLMKKFMLLHYVSLLFGYIINNKLFNIKFKKIEKFSLSMILINIPKPRINVSI